MSSFTLHNQAKEKVIFLQIKLSQLEGEGIFCFSFPAYKSNIPTFKEKNLVLNLLEE